jgi:hypothetical protein
MIGLINVKKHHFKCNDALTRQGSSPDNRQSGGCTARVGMPRYFLDVQDGHCDRDDLGIELASLNEAIAQAEWTLPAIALNRMPRDGDHVSLAVVRDEARKPVYTATLSVSGLRLDP